VSRGKEASRPSSFLARRERGRKIGAERFDLDEKHVREKSNERERKEQHFTSTRRSASILPLSQGAGRKTGRVPYLVV